MEGCERSFADYKCTQKIKQKSCQKAFFNRFFIIFVAMEDFTDIDWLWIDANLNEDVSRLRLKHGSDRKRMFEIVQIDCRQRNRRKLAETLRRYPRFVFDSTLAGEQSTSDLLARFHASLVRSGDKVLDMTGGLGIDALHLAEAGAEVLMAELDEHRASCARHNVRLLESGNLSAVCGDSVELLKGCADDSFDVIYIDPARRGEHGERLYALSQCRPDVTVLLDEMLRVAPTVIIKASPMLDITQIRRELHSISEIVSVGTRDECKEVDIICRRDRNDDCHLRAVTILSDGQISEFKLVEPYESIAPGYALPKVGGYIYEPYPAVAKLNVGQGICSQTGVRQIAANTHFYVSDCFNDLFPGQGYEITDLRVMSKRTLKELAQKYPRLDVTTRNFPMTAAELTKRMKVKPSGIIRLLACKDSGGENLLIVCHRPAED